MEEDIRESGEYGLRLTDLWAIIREGFRYAIVSIALVGTGAAIYNLTATRKYSSTATIRLMTTAGQELKVDRLTEQDAFNRAQRTTFVETQIEIIKSRKLREAVIHQYNLLNHDDLTPENGGINKLKGITTVKTRRTSELIDISVEYTNPDGAAILANLIAEQYQQHNLDGAKEDAKQALGWLETKLVDYQTRANESNAELIEYQRANELASTQEGINGLAIQLSSLTEALAQVHADRVQHESAVNSYTSFRRRGAYESLAKNLDSPLIISLTQDYAEAVTEHAQVAARYGEKHPSRRYLEAKLSQIESELHRELDRSLSAEQARLELLIASETDLENDILNIKQLLLEQKPLEAEFERIRLEHERNLEFYAALGQRSNELELSSETQLSNVRIIDEARPNPNAVKPQTMLNMVGALFAGGVLGVVFILARDYFDDTVSSPTDVATHLRVPYIGLVPLIEDAVDDVEMALYTHINPKSIAAETMRALRTVLEMSHGNGRLQRLLVTSTIAGEGKTSLAVHLGIAFSRLGKRVIIVDAELRRPKIHKIFQVPRENGLSAVLDGMELESAILQTEVPNLHVLPAGAGGERANELLASVYLTEVLSQLDQRYDLLILDTPPAGMVPDAAILSKCVDGVAMLVKESATSRVKVRDTIQALQQVGATVFGVVLNAVDLGRSSSFVYDGYGYDQGPVERAITK